MWLWLPSGTSHNQISPWMSVFALSTWRECNELHFISGLPPVGVQLVTGTADFIRHFPPMSAASTRSRGRCSQALLAAVEGVMGATPPPGRPRASLASGGVRPPLLGVI